MEPVPTLDDTRLKFICHNFSEMTGVKFTLGGEDRWKEFISKEPGNRFQYRINVQRGEINKGKVGFYASLPTDRKRNQYPSCYDEERKASTMDIRVSLAKSDDQIARDIYLRLWPDYIKLFARGMELASKADARDDAFIELSKHVAKLTGNEYLEGSSCPRYTCYKDGGNVDVYVQSHDTLKVEFICNKELLDEFMIFYRKRTTPKLIGKRHEQDSPKRSHGK